MGNPVSVLSSVNEQISRTSKMVRWSITRMRSNRRVSASAPAVRNIKIPTVIRIKAMMMILNSLTDQTYKTFRTLDFTDFTDFTDFMDFMDFTDFIDYFPAVQSFNDSASFTRRMNSARSPSSSFPLDAPARAST